MEHIRDFFTQRKRQIPRAEQAFLQRAERESEEADATHTAPTREG